MNDFARRAESGLLLLDLQLYSGTKKKNEQIYVSRHCTSMQASFYLGIQILSGRIFSYLAHSGPVPRTLFSAVVAELSVCWPPQASDGLVAYFPHKKDRYILYIEQQGLRRYPARACAGVLAL